MELLFWVNLYHQLGVGLCVGSSTHAMVFYHVVLAQGYTSWDQHRFLHIVYRLLRIGMAIAISSELLMFVYSVQVNNYLYWTHNPEVLMRLTLLGVILVNAILMQTRRISMWIAPAIAGGSWYAYFFFSVFVDIRWVDTGWGYAHLLAGYGVWLTIVAAVVIGLRLYLTRHHARAPGNTYYRDSLPEVP
ncbi:MAG: hypothetical protein P8101_04995 [Candidatus Thiodiazotropha sp.]